jgi:hypothetical protein
VAVDGSKLDGPGDKQGQQQQRVQPEVIIAVESRGIDRDGVQAVPDGQGQQQGSQRSEGQHQTQPPGVPTQQPAQPPSDIPSHSHPHRRPASVWASDAVALCILLLLTGLSIGYGVVWAQDDVYINGQPGTVMWYGMLVGPFGCLLRWHLAGFNARPAPGTASSGTTWWVLFGGGVG